MASTLLNNKPISPRLWLLLGLAPGVACAASDWKVTSGLNLSERYTDNLSLVATGAQSAFVTQIAPNIAASRRGKRGEVNLAYTLNDLLYDSGKNDVSHDFNAGMRLEPVVGVFKVVGSARVGQQYASQFLPTSSEFYHTTANRAETRTVSLTPSLHNELFDRRLITDASVTLNHASSDSALLNANTSRAMTLSMRNGSRPERLTYSGNYSRSSGDSQGGTTTGFESGSYNIGYAIVDRTRVFLAGGSNNSKGVSTLQGQGGDFLSVGVNWSPTNHFALTTTAGRSNGKEAYSLTANWRPSRKLGFGATVGRRNDAPSYEFSTDWIPDSLTSLSASAQKNFNSATFGLDTATNGLSAYGYTAYSLNLNRRIRRAVLGLRYSESVVDASQQLDQNVLFPFYTCGDGAYLPVIPGEAIPDGCTVVGVPGVYTQLLNQTTYSKTWAGSVNYSLGRSTFAFTLSQSRRQYLGSAAGGADKQSVVSGSWSRPLSGRTKTALVLSRSTAETATQDSDSWSINWSLTHQITPRVSGMFNARHSEQTGNGVIGKIEENTVSAQLGMTF